MLHHDMINTMYKNLIIVGTGNFINALGGFIYLLAVARVLTVEDYGKYAFLIATSLLLAKFTELGTTSSFVTQSIKNSKNYRKSLLFLKIGLTALVIVANTIILHFYNLLNLHTFLAFLIGYVGYSANDYIFALSQLSENFINTTLVNMLPALFKLILGIAFIFAFRNVTLNQTLYFYFLALLTSFFILPAIKKDTYEKEVETTKGIKDLANKGFLGGLSQALNLSVPALNSNLILLKSNFSQLGIFALSEKLSSIFVLASMTIFTVLLPKKAKEVKEKNKYDFSQVFILSFLIVLAAGIMIALSKPTLNLLFPKYIETLPILYLMIISASLTAIATFMDNYFYIVEKTLNLLALNILKVLILGVSVFVLTAKYGIIGAAYANIITSVTILLLTFVTIKKIKAN